MYKKNKKKIIIVGGTGFLGYYLLKNFIKKNWNVISLSRNKPSSFKKIKKVNYKFVDISNKKKLFKILDNIKNIDYLINLGGEVLHNKKRRVYLSHYIGCKNLAKFYLKKKIKKFIQIGSSMEYGQLKSPQNENSKFKPLSDYGKSKAMATKYLINLSKKYSFPAVILRLYQVYGPLQDANRFIPYVIKNCLNNNSFECSSGKQFRDFLFIDDFVSLINKCINKKKIIGEIINVGYGRPIKLLNVINFITKTLKLGKPLFGKIKLRKEENLKTFPSIKKASRLLKWKPKISFKRGLIQTINHFEQKVL